jgi:hypothetical protein
MGAVWRYVIADSAGDIIERFSPKATVFTTPPPWMEEADLATLPIEDIDDDAGFLGGLSSALAKRRIRPDKT